MAIPNVTKIAKDAIEDCNEMVKRNIKKIVLDLLGFDASWHDVKLKNNSPLIPEILEFEEFKALKVSVIEEIRKELNINPLTIKGKRELISSIRDQIYWDVKKQIENELIREYSVKAFDLVKNDPSISPILIAEKLIEANSKSKIGK